MKNIPKRIYLRVGNVEITWSLQRIKEIDIAYILEKESHWISVEDRLPEISELDLWRKEVKTSDDFFTYSLEYGRRIGRYSYLYNGWILEGVGHTVTIIVTHFMPLPEKPQTK